MSEQPVRNSREIDTRLHNGHQIIERLLSQIQLGKIDPKLLTQRLTTIQETLDKVIEDRKFTLEDERFARLYKVSRLIGSSLDLQTVLEQVMDAIVQLTRAERGFLMLIENGNLEIRVARNFDQMTLAGDAVAISRTVTSRVVETGQPLVTTNAQEDPRFAGQASIVANSLSSIMASPLVAHNQVIGVIYVDNRAMTGLFSDDDLVLLAMFGEQAAIAIDNAVKVREREDRLKAEIEGLKIEIDEVKKTRQVNEIVDSEYFQRLRERAQRQRDRGAARREEDTSQS